MLSFCEHAGGNAGKFPLSPTVSSGIRSPSEVGGTDPAKRKTLIYQGFFLLILATLMGLEPTTFAVTGRRSNQLSYSAIAR